MRDIELKRSTLWVPLPFCEAVLRQQYYKEAQLFLALKFNCSGQCKIDNDMKDSIGYWCSVSDRTVHRWLGDRLDSLLERNWIGFNPESGWYFIRSFDKLGELEGFKGRTAAELSVKNLQYFRVFAAGAVIGYLVNHQKKERGPESKMRGSNHSPLSQYGTVASSALSSVLSVSYATAYRLKRQATELGFITKAKSFKPLHIPAKLRSEYVKATGNEHVITRDGMLVLQLPDLIKPNIKYKKI